MFLTQIHKIEKEGMLSNLVYEASVTLIQKLDKDTTATKNYRSISLMNIKYKNPQKYLQTKFSNTL
jgi:hypothetical protein